MSRELILFTPGPVRIPASVAQSLANPPCNYHRQDAFCEMFRETERDLKALIGIKDPSKYFATILTATGTGANEACLLALEPFGKGLIATNGFFGNRAVDQAKQNGMVVEVRDYPHDRPLDPAAIARELDADPDIKWVFFVSHETRTGLRNPFEEIGQVCKDPKRDVMVAVDLISSAFAYAVDLERSQVDLATASSAKAVMAAPGLGVVFTRLASVPRFEQAVASKGKPRGYYLDVIAECRKQQAEHQPRFAQPVALHAALHAACVHLREQGIDAHIGRIQRQMKTLIDHLATKGIAPMLDARYRSNIAVNFQLPKGIEYPAFSKKMEELGYFLLYGIPGDKTHFQLSTIGDLTDDQIEGVKKALTTVLGS